ncbi:MAG: hypothetical protein QOJ61_2957, partial [Mycobacterium sp.]|nr:hypothetical protein [Mycobacterium sp.]
MSCYPSNQSRMLPRFLTVLSAGLLMVF